MTYFLAAICLAAWFFGFLLLFVAKSSVHEILASIFLLCGLVAIVGIGVINAIDKATARLPEPPQKPTEVNV
jgi:hypothetical protein